MKESDEELRLRREILNYFLRNPEAADDIEGIARWRLLQETISRRLDDTNRAVEWLVSEGFLSQVKTGGGAVFRLNRRKQGNARKFVKGEDD